MNNEHTEIYISVLVQIYVQFLILQYKIGVNGRNRCANLNEKADK
jgi:hypothetical protein